MRLTEYIQKKRFAPGPGVTEPPPKEGAKRFFFILANHFGKMIALNLLFLAFCLPVLTIPAALCGANRVLINLVNEGHCFLWQDFIKEFKGSFFKSLPFGFLAAFLLLDSFLAYQIGVSGGGVRVGMAALAIALFGVCVLFSGYAFVFIAALPLKGRHIAKNALILMFTEWKTNLVILAGAAALPVLTALIAYRAPVIALTLLLFIYFSFSRLLVCTAVFTPMRRRIVEPYEQARQKEEADCGAV